MSPFLSIFHLQMLFLTKSCFILPTCLGLPPMMILLASCIYTLNCRIEKVQSSMPQRNNMIVH